MFIAFTWFWDIRIGSSNTVQITDSSHVGVVSEPLKINHSVLLIAGKCISVRWRSTRVFHTPRPERQTSKKCILITSAKSQKLDFLTLRPPIL